MPRIRLCSGHHTADVGELIREELAQLTEATSKVEIQGGRYLSP